MMGHMDDNGDEKQTITVFNKYYEQTFHECSEIEANENQLSFKDKSGKHHQFFGVSYHITRD